MTAVSKIFTGLEFKLRSYIHIAYFGFVFLFTGLSAQDVTKKDSLAVLSSNHAEAHHQMNHVALFAEHTEFVFGMVVFYRLGEAFWIRTGPGIEIIQEEDHASHDHAT